MGRAAKKTGLVRPASLHFFSSEKELEDKDSFHEYLKILDKVDREKEREKGEAFLFKQLKIKTLDKEENRPQRPKH